MQLFMSRTTGFSTIVGIGLLTLFGAAEVTPAGYEPLAGARGKLVAGRSAAGERPVPRGEGTEEINAGDCEPVSNNLEAGIFGSFLQGCGDGNWLGLAFPVSTNGAVIESINMVLNTNEGIGDLYLMGDCGGNPDVKNILWTGCGCIQGAPPGETVNFCIGEPIESPATTWVVAVPNTDLAFEIAFDCDQDAPGQGFANLADEARCGGWIDLTEFPHGIEECEGRTFGGCYFVSLVIASSGNVACCETPALCAGDVNGDGMVDPLDSGFVLTRLGMDVEADTCQADVNCDGLIDPLDLGFVLSRFGICGPVMDCPIGGGSPEECADAPPAGCGEASCPAEAPLECCEIHPLQPGCNSVCGTLVGPEVEECVCAVDESCCTAGWDLDCVEAIEVLGCADCSKENPDCAVPDPCAPEAGDCCSPNNTPGCEEQACCNSVCSIDPFCCDASWDELCADEAAEVCDICGGAAPLNDDCPDGAVIADGTTAFSTVGATTDGPELPPECDEGFGLSLVNDIWYEYTASCTGTVSVSTCSDADYDTRLAAYLSDDCPPTVLVACNDDSVGCAHATSLLEFKATTGNRYRVRVGGFGGSGSGILTIACDQ